MTIEELRKIALDMYPDDGEYYKSEVSAYCDGFQDACKNLGISINELEDAKIIIRMKRENGIPYRQVGANCW
jgi:hypothetical protein